jgi:anaerobic ribonucleoside-triphosphate reductase activating protein
MSPELQARRSEWERSVEAVFAEVCTLAPGHDGITVSGGEPLEQAEELKHLLELVRQNTALDVMLYTGFTLEEIERDTGAKTEVVELCDILVDGPFRADLTNRRMWRGSDNQRLYLLAERAQKYRPLAETEYGARRPLSLMMAKDGSLRIIGIPERGFKEKLIAGAASRGVTLGGGKGE